jgi:hypothetical protein
MWYKHLTKKNLLGGPKGSLVVVLASSKLKPSISLNRILPLENDSIQDEIIC